MDATTLDVGLTHAARVRDGTKDAAVRDIPPDGVAGGQTVFRHWQGQSGRQRRIVSIFAKKKTRYLTWRVTRIRLVPTREATQR